jgi:hypothetical protein
VPDRPDVHMWLRTLEFTFCHVRSPFLSADYGIAFS